ETGDQPQAVQASYPEILENQFKTHHIPLKVNGAIAEHHPAAVAIIRPQAFCGDEVNAIPAKTLRAGIPDVFAFFHRSAYTPGRSFIRVLPVKVACAELEIIDATFIIE
ncbi:UNVERIFIED_CONTAM: hypothetical protein IGO34_25885, partial [Salmonella enterica subsp. enterica serovar Weltevreden]